MSLPWVRLDSNWYANPKILELAHSKQWQAIVAYQAGLGWSGSHGTDGYLPDVVLPVIHATRTIAQRLEDVMLWIPTIGGWDINGWTEFQPSTEEHAARKVRAKLASGKANCRRWHGPDCGCWMVTTASDSDPKRSP